jgi:hypothetical protein
MVKHKGTPGAGYACGAWLQPVPEGETKKQCQFRVKRFGCSGLLRVFVRLAGIGDFLPIGK